MAAVMLGEVRHRSVAGHARWVRISHWILAASVLTLAVSGFVILMAHPRLYWGAGRQRFDAGDSSNSQSAATTSTADGPRP